MRRTKRGRTSLFSLSLLAFLGIFAYGAFLFGPIQWHYLLVKKCVKDALLEYQLSGALSSAKTKIKSSFYREKVPRYLDAERVCKLRESRRTLTVTCQWNKEVIIPVLEKKVIRRFDIHMSIDESGVIEQF